MCLETPSDTLGQVLCLWLFLLQLQLRQLALTNEVSASKQSEEGSKHDGKGDVLKVLTVRSDSCEAGGLETIKLAAIIP